MEGIALTATHRSVVISLFALVVLGILGILFNKNHPELVGGGEDPENGPEVASTIFTAIIIYIVCCVPIRIKVQAKDC